MKQPKCTDCALKLRLEKWDYSQSGVPKTEEGYVCMAFAHEGLAVQMVGTDPDRGGCEMFKEKQ